MNTGHKHLEPIQTLDQHQETRVPVETPLKHSEISGVLALRRQS